VAIARALMVEPKVLLYDEPGASTPRSRPRCGARSSVAEHNGTTQLVVTHDEALATGLTRSVYVLEAGTLRFNDR
jgi:arginine transport system ATP-binding protein